MQLCPIPESAIKVKAERAAQLDTVVWSAVPLARVSTAFLANLVGRLPANHVARSAMINELTYRYETER